jgi:hypothetical protein
VASFTATVIHLAASERLLNAILDDGILDDGDD